MSKLGASFSALSFLNYYDLHLNHYPDPPEVSERSTSMTPKAKLFSREDAIQAAEHLIDTYPMLETVQELFDAGRLEKLFDGHQQAMATWGRLMSRVRPENCGPIPNEDQIRFANYYIELRNNDEIGFHFAAGRKNTSSNGYVLKYQEEIFQSYEEASDYIDAIEKVDLSTPTK